MRQLEAHAGYTPRHALMLSLTAPTSTFAAVSTLGARRRSVGRVWATPTLSFLFGDFAGPARKIKLVSKCVTTFKTIDFADMTSKMRDHGQNAQNARFACGASKTRGQQ